MQKQIKENSGITLVILTITVVVMVILAGVSISLIERNQNMKQELGAQEEEINIFYGATNDIQTDIQEELRDDYSEIITDSQVSNDVPNATTQSEWTGTMNAPRLLEDMTAIYYNESGTEVALTTASSEEEWNNWYDYSNKIWANAKTSDGSYWVWIPRFAYKITDEINEGDSSNISIIFVDNQNKNSINTYSTEYPELENGKMSDYVVHPAFVTNLGNGGSNTNISGFWIAKYEISREDSSNGGTTWAYAAGTDTLTKNAGETSSIRAVSKPNVSSWTNIKISNAYTNSYYYNRDANSHLIKNSEWGAVAYLTQSAYGRDGEEVTVNDSATYVTGTGGIAASSTGNASGVYDLSGGAFEFVSAYILNETGGEFRTLYGSAFATTLTSTEYVTIYPHNETTDSSTANWTAYNNSRTSRFGDAMLETSTAGDGTTAWNSDTSIYPSLETPFIVRSGQYADTEGASGIFSFDSAKGNAAAGYGYRIVIF